MTRSRLLLVLASTFAGLAAVLAVLGVVYSLVLIPVAVPFAGTAYLLWYHATGRLVERARRKANRDRVQQEQARDRFRRRAAHRLGTDGTGAARRGSRSEGSSAGASARRSADGPTRREAADLLGVPVNADEATVRAAYRDRAKELHPDAEEGSEEAFKRVAVAYERLAGK